LALGWQVTSGQVALAWLLAKKPWIVPIPGTRSLERLDENIAAVDIQLTPEDLCQIDRTFAELPVYGERYTLPGTTP
jgi:aryl-alcohol dehydrogenase-like predicted oxidoreductase